MDIVNFDALKAQGRIIDPSQVNPEEDYFIIGKYTNHYSTNSQKYTKYPVYAIKAGDVMGGGTPTLQQVLDFNHDLLDGNNYQGTGAGVGNTGSEINALGTSAAKNNIGNYINAFGYSAAFNNLGSNVNAIGARAAQDNTGTNVIAIGSQTAKENTGNNVIAFGQEAAYQNTGNYVMALGANAGEGNSLSGMFIISNNELPSYADHAAAVAAISPTGIPNNTYIYHNQATMSIGAVRL
jgi:hypothetical protein